MTDHNGNNDEVRRLLHRPIPSSDDGQVGQIVRRAKRMAATRDLLRLAFASTFHGAVVLLKLLAGSSSSTEPNRATQEQEREP